MTASFQSATACLWAAVFKAGAFLGCVPVWWRGGRSRPLSRPAIMTALLCTQIFITICQWDRPQYAKIPIQLLLYGTAEALVYASRRYELAMLLRCMWQYQALHPLSTAWWRRLFVVSFVFISLSFADLAYSVFTAKLDISWLQLAGDATLKVVKVGKHFRIISPLVLLGSAAAEFHLDCRRRGRAERVLLGSHAWRALRQRQFLLHDMIRKSSDVNGPCLLYEIISVYLIFAFSPLWVKSFFAEIGEEKLLSLLVHNTQNLFFLIFVTVCCLWPAFEVFYAHNIHIS